MGEYKYTPWMAYEIALALIKKAKGGLLKKASEELDLRSFGLEKLPPQIGQLTNLTKLSLQNNSLSELPPQIGQLRKLTTLDLSNNSLTDLPSQIGELTTLTKLVLNHNSLSELPPSIKHLKNLEWLGLENNLLSKFPPKIGELNNLTTLFLNSNSLSELPPSIKHLKCLEWLSLGNNLLSKLPPQIGELKNLIKLYLEDNSLSELPTQIGELNNLTELYLENSSLKGLPSQIGELKSLTILFLQNNSLTVLPHQIGELINLKTLSIAGNSLTALPPQLGELINLTTLVLRDNSLSEWPHPIGELKNLTTLVLSENSLSELPPQIGELKNLTTLFLEKNSLSELPRELKELRQLNTNKSEYVWEKGLQLQGNPFNGVPEEVFELEPQEMIRTILEIQKANEAGTSRPLHEAKVIFIGDGEVGKTSLIKILTTGSYDPKEHKTDGIDIYDWEITEGKDTIDTHIWDFGGQEIMHATHKFFMTARSAYVLVVTPRQEDQSGEGRLEYWLKLIQSYAGKEVPILVVLNKCDVHKMALGKGALRDKYPQISGFVETSCETEQGIDEYIQKVSTMTLALPHIRDKIPGTWFQIKEALQEKNEEYLSYEHYQNLCEETETGFREFDMKILALLLHDLGVMLNFRNEFGEVANTQVLNPEWVTKGVYRIITSPQLIEQKGILKLTEIGELLKSHPDASFPRSTQWRLITNVMERFELTFQFAGKQNTFFIPGGFPKDSPDDLSVPEKGETTRFQYQYDVLPGSVLSRLMVQAHAHIRKQDFWRYGFVVEREKCTTLITSDQVDKKITIQVWGDGKHPVMMAYIRGLLEGIHKSYELSISRSVPIERNGNSALLDYDDLLFHERKGREMMLVRELDDEIDVREILQEIDGWRGANQSELVDLIRHGKIEDAFHSISGPKSNDLIQLESRWNTLRINRRKGQMTQEEYAAALSKITEALLVILQEEDF